MGLENLAKIAAYSLGERALIMGGDGHGVAQSFMQILHETTGGARPSANEMDRVAAGHRPSEDFEIAGFKIPRFLFEEEAPVKAGEVHDGSPRLKSSVKYGGIALGAWALLKGASGKGFSPGSYGLFDTAWNAAWLLGFAPYNKGGAIPQAYAEGLIPNWGHMMPALENPQRSPFGWISRLIGM